MVERLRRWAAPGVCFLVAAACGGEDATAPGPVEVTFGETTFVVAANPIVNGQNATPVPAPGTARSGVTVSTDQGTSSATDENGVAVLSPAAAGTRTLSVNDGSLSGQVIVSISEKDLSEVAIALDGSGAAVMANVRYPFGGQVIEVTPSMPLSEVNAALGMSNVIVFFRGGIYTGDLVFSGSDVTLFGQGEKGGQVTLDGDVTVEGSGNRIRGSRITGSLVVTGSDAGLSFTRVAGALDLAGSSATLLNNSFCGSATVSGSNATLLGNEGLAPIPAPSSGC